MALSYPTIKKKYVAPTTGGAGNTVASMASSPNPYEYNPGGSGDQAGGASSGTSSGTVQPQSYIGGEVQKRDAMSNLPGDLAASYQNTLASMMSGDAYSAYKTSQFQGMNKSAQQLRANAQNANVGRAGQGTAVANKNVTENSIAQMAGDTALNAAMGEQEMKERGITAANTLSSMNEGIRQAGITQGMNTDQQYGYVDPATGKRISGSGELAQRQVDIAQQEADTTKDLGYANIGSSEKIAGMNISSNEKISGNQLNESARQFNINSDTDKAQFAETMKLNYDQLSENQKQFLANFGLDEAKFDQAKSEFGQNIALAEKQFNEKLNFDYDTLSQQDKEFLAKFGLDEDIFEESRRQYNKTTALEERFRTRDLDLQEQALAQEASQFTDRLSFDRWATQSGLDDAAANRIWQATQNDNQLRNSQQIALMQNDTERWKQLEVAELTKAGWTVEDARASADRNQQFTLAAMQNNLTREIESGRITQAQAELAQQASQFTTQQAWTEKAAQLGIDQETAKMAWTTNERVASEAFTASQNTYQGQLQKEITQMGLTVEESKLLENRRQFESKSMFDTYVFEQGLDQAAADRLWETNERIETQIFQGNLQALQNEMSLKGIKYQTTMSYLESLDEDQAHDVLQALAVDAGISYVVTDKNGQTIIDQKTGKPVTEVGFPPAHFEASQKGYDLAVQLENGEIQTTNFRSGNDPKSPAYENYQALLNTAKTYTLQSGYNAKAERLNISNPPKKGTVIKMDGKAYQVVSDVVGTKGQADSFMVEDLATGEQKKIQPKW